MHLKTIGMERMTGRHTAENIKIGLESIINKFELDKCKILSVNTDEGRNIRRLFKQSRNPTSSNSEDDATEESQNEEEEEEGDAEEEDDQNENMEIEGEGESEDEDEDDDKSKTSETSSLDLDDFENNSTGLTYKPAAQTTEQDMNMTPDYNDDDVNIRLKGNKNIKKK